MQIGEEHLPNRLLGPLSLPGHIDQDVPESGRLRQQRRDLLGDRDEEMQEQLSIQQGTKRRGLAVKMNRTRI